jgi:hypothetical protein
MTTQDSTLKPIEHAPDCCAHLLPYQRCEACQRLMLLDDTDIKIGKRLLFGQ